MRGSFQASVSSGRRLDEGGHRRLACERYSCRNLIDEQQRPAPARPRRPCPFLRAPARQRARLPEVGMARRRRPIFAATPPSHPDTALPRLRLGTPTARRPYHFFTKGAVAPTPAQQRELKTYKLKP
jgi:hypothetical protein